MMRWMIPVGLAMTSCATSSSGRGPDPLPVTVDEALAEIESFRKRFGTEPPPPAAPPTSMNDVLDVILDDELHRYPAARSFADGQTGVEALTIRSVLELSWAASIRTVKELLAERRARLTAEAKALEVRVAPTEQDTARLAELKDEITAYTRIDRALLILMEPHRQAGGDLAEETLRRFPNHAEGHVAAAFYYRLTRNWAKYGEEDRYLEARGHATPMVDFLRAMAELERGNRPESCRQRLAALRDASPEFIRAQAELVLVPEDIADTWQELQRLKAVSPNHFLIRLAGPTIEKEYETSSSLRGPAN